MTVDCQWIEKHLEPLFCDTLNEEENRLARAHIENCAACRKEVHALNAIDPLIKKHFQRELEIARRPRAVNTSRAWGLSAAGVGLAAVAVLLFVVLRLPQTNPTVTPVPAATAVAPAGPIETPGTSGAPAVAENAAGNGVDNSRGSGQVKPERAKPAPGVDRIENQKRIPAPAVGPNAPDFAITDAAGYSHTVGEYRNHVVVIGVWSAEQPEVVANLERLYREYAKNPKFRFLGVANDRLPKPANTTFPVVYNQGSKLFGAHSGDFVLLDEKGGIELRGSLVTGFDTLRRTLQAK